MDDLNFVQSLADPCMCYRQVVVACVYVDNLCCFCQKKQSVKMSLQQLQKLGFTVKSEGDVALHVGAHVERHRKKCLKLSQPQLTNRIISTLGLESSDKKNTPATKVLHKDDSKRKEEWHHCSVI